MAGCWEIEWEKVGRGWKGKENGVVPKDTMGLWESAYIASVFLFHSKILKVENTSRGFTQELMFSTFKILL